MFKRLSLILLLVFTISNVYALEFGESGLKTQFYGQLHMGGFYVNSNNAMTRNNNSVITGVGNDVRDSFDIALYDYSRFGADLIFGNFSGTVELQANGDEPFRRYYIQYNFANGSNLAFGKDWTLAGYSYNQYANEYQGLWDYGTLTELRSPQIRFSMKGWQVALIYADGALAADNTVIIPAAGEGNYSKKNSQVLPRIEAAYNYTAENLSYKLFGAYGRYSTKAVFTDETKTIEANTYAIGAGIQYNIKGFFISATGFFGENLYLYGALTNMLIAPVYNQATNHYTSVQSFGVAGNIGYNLNANVIFSLGAGYTNSSNSSFKTGARDEQFSAFFNVPMIVAKYLTVIPEISYFDEMKDFAGNYQGTAMYYGIYLLAQF